jgi:dipeptidyl aminopeptidase/acylaminoacyl peptidase
MRCSFRTRPWGMALAFLSLTSALDASAAAKRPFTVTEEIGIADFGDPSQSGRVAPITWSPDRKWVAVVSARGRLADNKMEAELRIYEVGALRRFATQHTHVLPPEPSWSITRSDYKAGPPVEDLHWTPDSSALAFRASPANGGSRLMYADLKSRTLTPLSREDQRVTAFDIIDRTHYVYAAQDPGVYRQLINHESAAVVLTGQSLQELLFPTSLYPERAALDDRSQVWRSNGDEQPRPVRTATGAPLILFREGLTSLRLSPDGQRLFTALPVEDVPPEWERLYPPPTANFPYRAVGGHQDLDTLQGQRLISRYVMIDLASSEMTFPVAGPTGAAAGWWTLTTPIWSPDSRQVAVGNAFVPNTEDPTAPAAPCVAVIDVVTHSTRCAERLPPGYTGAPNSGYAPPDSLQFDLSAGRALNVEYKMAGDEKGVRHYLETAERDWALASAPYQRHNPVVLAIQQSVDEPPVLTATSLGYHAPKVGAAHIVWDPNPQLQQVDLPKTRRLNWKDETGRQWSGGLYVPADYQPGKRYPLVIQTHGFFADAFRPSGLYPTGYAARALAASGIVVLEARCAVETATAEEGPCQVRGYEAAVEMLSADNTIDPERIGIVGFSRTCYYVLEALTRSELHFSAASITDGVNEGYWQYLLDADFLNNAIASEADIMNGATPWGPGLATWLNNSPLFNMGKVDTPLQVVGEGMASLASMWEPYALQRYRKKPVELVLLNTDEHVLTTPAVRLASQGGTLDWMRFWLLGAEDSNPDKTAQNRRWEQLCDLQAAHPNGHPLFCRSSKH